MQWQRSSDLIVAMVLSIAYTIVTFLNIIGPLHMNATGAINKIGYLSLYSLLFWIFSLLITWALYFCLRKKTELLFFILICAGIILIIIEIFLWGWIGP